MQTKASNSGIMGFWLRLPVLIRAIISGVFVSSIGVYAWLAVGAILPAPLAFVVMGMLLWLYVKYFSGSWWPKSTAEARRKYFRSIKLSPAAWRWSILAAVLIVVNWQSAMVLTFRIIEFPAETFTAGYDVEALPLWIAWLMILMSSLVAGICEETGYRGYMQVPLEVRYRPWIAIVIVSVLFLIIHLPQVWAPPVLIHLFTLSALLGILAYAAGSLIPSIIAHVSLDIFNFSYWWTDVAGTFDRRPVTETGIDVHFVLWALVFVASALLFVWSVHKTLSERG